MIQRLLLRLLAALALTVTLAHARPPVGGTELDPSVPTSNVDVAQSSLIGWCAIERRVRRGVRQGVRSFRFSESERDDVIAVSMARAWRAFADSDDPIRNPEGWGQTIAQRVSLDEVRRQRRDRLRTARPIDGDPTGPTEVVEHLASAGPSPLALAIEGERRALVRERIAAWPDPERRLAELVLDGHADTLTAAAKLYRAEEVAARGEGSMYALKARTLLGARSAELEDLV